MKNKEIVKRLADLTHRFREVYNEYEAETHGKYDECVLSAHEFLCEVEELLSLKRRDDPEETVVTGKPERIIVEYHKLPPATTCCTMAEDWHIGDGYERCSLCGEKHPLSHFGQYLEVQVANDDPGSKYHTDKLRMRLTNLRLEWHDRAILEEETPLSICDACLDVVRQSVTTWACKREAIQEETKEDMSVSIEALQEEVLKWARENFGEQDPTRVLLGVQEELGELCHARLKSIQGIRTEEDHEAAEKDAIGDLLIYLLNYCGERGINMEKCLYNTWNEVKQRDWKKNPKKGTVKDVLTLTLTAKWVRENTVLVDSLTMYTNKRRGMHCILHEGKALCGRPMEDDATPETWCSIRSLRAEDKICATCVNKALKMRARQII